MPVPPTPGPLPPSPGLPPSPVPGALVSPSPKPRFVEIFIPKLVPMPVPKFVPTPKLFVPNPGAKFVPRFPLLVPSAPGVLFFGGGVPGRTVCPEPPGRKLLVPPGRVWPVAVEVPGLTPAAAEPPAPVPAPPPAPLACAAQSRAVKAYIMAPKVINAIAFFITPFSPLIFSSPKTLCQGFNHNWGLLPNFTVGAHVARSFIKN